MSFKGYTHPEEWRKKQSEKLKGKKRKPFSEETRRNMSLSHLGKKRKPHTEETKMKQREKMKGKHCSPATEFKKGFKHTEEWKKQASEKISGDKNPAKRLDVRKKISLAKMGHKVSEEQIKSQKIKMKKWYKENKHPKGMLGKHHTEEMKKQRKKESKELWKDEKYREKTLKGLGFKPTKPEKQLNELLQNNFPNQFIYMGDGKVWFDRFNPDFVCNPSKLIIEMFGDYWHNREDRKVKDIERLETYSKYGYKTLIIWEHELKNSELVLNKIKKFVLNSIISIIV